MPLDLSWDRESPWIDAAGRRLPARPVIAGEDEDGARWWAAGIPFENRGALLVIVDEDDCGSAEDAVVHLVLPVPGGGWEEQLDAVPCKVVDRRIRPAVTINVELPEAFDWLLSDGWWARLDDAAELHRYVALFGSLASPADLPPWAAPEPSPSPGTNRPPTAGLRQGWGMNLSDANVDS